MEVFMQNKAIFQDFNRTAFEDEVKKNATIDYLYHVRKNIDTACATKILLAHTLYSQYPRSKAVPLSDLFKFVNVYSYEFKKMAGPDLNHFELFLRHFPLVFKVKNRKVNLRSMDMQELKNRYKAIIRRPKYLFEDGLLPKGLQSTFKVTLVTDPSKGDEIARDILTNHGRVAIDLEGYNLGLNGLITLCQVAVSSDHVYLFDILECPYFLSKGVLKRLLESKRVQKVFHGISGDAANLYRQFNITLRQAYDTQAAFKTMQLKFPDLRMGYGGCDYNGDWKVSLNDLMALYKFDTNQIKGAVKSLYRNNPNLWSYRPLCPALLHYAGEDVDKLLQLQDAINHHPRFKPDHDKTVYETEKAIYQQMKAATYLKPWVKPSCPPAKSAIRGKPSHHKSNNGTQSKKYNVTQDPRVVRLKREVRDKISPLEDNIVYSNEMSSDAAGSPFVSLPYSSSPPQDPMWDMKNSCLFIVTIGFFFIFLFNRFRLWKKKSSLMQKKKYYQQQLLINTFNPQDKEKSKMLGFKC
uniref:3'-5' exonuclease domain-containing protein n=1 Tax=Cacopsylla melanoneura TaxID=428564 RepID=A0A8D8LYW8_9HEMI